MNLRTALWASSAVLVLAGAFFVPNAGAALSSQLHTHPCRVGTSKTPEMCGTFTVYENRAAKTGRRIALHFIVIKAKHPGRHAIAWNPGGPGGSSTQAAPMFADSDSALKTLHDQYDLLLLDNRGTGESAPQQCDFAPLAHPELYFMQLWPDRLVKACRDRLAARADLSLYSTSVAADDLDDVRAALGYRKLALFGGSYGTRFYLAYARQHPEHVESIALEGVVPPHFYILPLPMAGGAQTSVDNLITACKGDATCASNFPALGEHFANLVRRFDEGPVRVPVLNSVTHRVQTVRLAKEVFAETLRHALYFPGDAAYIPVIVERAYHGDYAALASLVDQMSQEFANFQSTGLNLSVSCVEDIPFITQVEVARTSAGSFEGDARVRAQQRACRIWKVRPVPQNFLEPVKTNLPILIISGSDDPASPPSYAKQALPYLPNARMMLVNGASHDSDYPPCVDRLIVSFIRVRSASGLEFDRCAATYHRPTFATLTYFESAPGEDAALTARFHSLFAEMFKGRIDRVQLTPAVSKEYSAGHLKQLASEASGLGEMESFVYRGAHDSGKGKTYLYVAHFVRGNANVTITLDSTGKIAVMDVLPV